VTDIQVIDEDEEEEGEKEGKEKDHDTLKSNIKSKKAFSMAINDKTMPIPIKLVSRFAYFVLAVFIAIALTEFIIVRKQQTEMEENFVMIQQSRLRTAEILKVVYNTRTMILLNKGTLTNYLGYDS